MNVIPMITLKSNLLIAIMHMLKLMQIFILVTLFITFPLMAITNIMTGCTYIPIIIFLQVLLGLNSHLRKVLKNV